DNPSAKVGANPFLLGLPKWSRSFVDREVCRLKEESLEKKGDRYTEQAPLWPTSVDMVVATLTVTAERKDQIDFSDAYYVTGLRLLSPAGSGVGSVSDLV